MLHYSNIINDPYPDTIDPVSGEWLPKSYNDVKADQKSERENASQMQELSMLMSILK